MFQVFFFFVYLYLTPPLSWVSLSWQGLGSTAYQPYTVHRAKEDGVDMVSPCTQCISQFYRGTLPWCYETRNTHIVASRCSIKTSLCVFAESIRGVSSGILNGNRKLRRSIHRSRSQASGSQVRPLAFLRPGRAQALTPCSSITGTTGYRWNWTFWGPSTFRQQHGGIAIRDATWQTVREQPELSAWLSKNGKATRLEVPGRLAQSDRAFDNVR